jgi:hypothetical protein
MLKDPEEVSKVTIKTSKYRIDPVAPILQSEAQKYIVNYFKANKILRGVHHDAVHLLYQGIIYLQKVISFHGRVVNEIHNKSTAFPALIFKQLTSFRQHYMHVSRTEFRPHQETNVHTADHNFLRL